MKAIMRGGPKDGVEVGVDDTAPPAFLEFAIEPPIKMRPLSDDPIPPYVVTAEIHRYRRMRHTDPQAVEYHYS